MKPRSPTSRTPIHATVGALAILAAVAGGLVHAQTSVQVPSTPAPGGGVGAGPAAAAPATTGGAQSAPPTPAGTSAAPRPGVRSNTAVQTEILPAPTGSGPAAPGGTGTGGGAAAAGGLTVHGAGNPPGMAPNVIGGTALPSGSRNVQGAAGNAGQAGGLVQMGPAGNGNGGQPQGPGLVVIPR